MLSVLFLLIGTAVVFGLARYNQSNKLFWTLLLAMMMGFAGGTIANAIINSDNSNSKHAGLYQGLPTQGLTLQTIGFEIPYLTDDENILAIAKPVGKAYSASNTTPAFVLQHNRSGFKLPKYFAGANKLIAMNLFDTS